MATFKPTSKAGRSIGSTSNKKTFTPTKYAGYRQESIYGWQAQNKSALDLINEYYNRINSGEWLSNEDRAKYKSAIDAYTTTGNALRDASKYYGTKYTDDEEKSWQDSLSSLSEGYTGVDKFYNQFANDKEYGAWKDMENKRQEYSSVSSLPDYEQYRTEGQKWNSGAPYLDKVNLNKVLTNTFEYGDYKEKQGLMEKYMTEDEWGIYNYYLGKGDTTKANEYLAFIDSDLKQRAADKTFEKYDNTALELFFSAGAGLDQFITGLRNVGNLVYGKEAISSPTSQYVASAMGQNNTGAWKVANDLTQTVANQLPSIGISLLGAGPIAAVTTPLSAGGGGYADMLSQGYSTNEARRYGVMTMASEYALQKALGGISALGGNGSGIFQSIASKVLPKVNNAIGRVAVQLGGNMLDEALEEGVQTALEPVFKYAATLGKEKIGEIDWEEVGYSALLGGLSAGLFEGAPTISNAVSTNLRTQKAFGSQAQDIVSDALKINPNNKLAIKAQNTINKGKQVSGLTLDTLINPTDTTKVREAVANRLTELGEGENVENLSNSIAKKIVGEKLNSKESKLIDNSKFAQRVLNELNPENIKSGQYTSKWAEEIGTRALNADVYSLREKKITTSTQENAAERIYERAEGVRDGLSSKLVTEAAQEKISRTPGFTEEAANVMTKGYTGEISASDYISTFDTAYKLGMNAAPATDVVKFANNIEGISQSTLLAAYDLGRHASENSVLQTQQESDIINTESEALTNEGTTVHLRDSNERIGSTNSEESVQQLEGSTGQIESGGRSIRPADSEAVNLVNEGREVRVADLGILNGSKTQTVRIVDTNKETKLMQKARKDAESKGLKIKFFVGDNIVITEQTGEISSIRGYVLGDTMLIRADHPVYTADQIERHEAGHKLIERGEIDIKQVRENVAKAVGGKENLDLAVQVYADAYSGTGMTAQEIWEECICDSLGDMNIFAKNKEVAGAMDYTIKEVQKAVAEQKTEPNKTRGSPDVDGKASREISNHKKKGKVPQRDDFATNAMIWAYSTKTDIGEQKIFYRKNNWVLLEKTNDGFIELGQYNSNHYDFINEEVNKHNEGLYNSGIDERIYSSIMRYENLGINDSRNYGNDVGQQTSNGRIGEIHQEQSESNRSGDSQSSSENKQKYSRELDTEYLSAVERGDMKTAQKMVDEAAKNWGAISLQGDVSTVFYHGTNESFTEFRPEEMSSVEGSYFFAENRMDAEAYGDNVYEVYLSARNLADYDNQPSEFYRLRDKRDQVAWLKERGYDGWYADMDSGGWGELSVFSPNQIKSADPVTYDDDGNVIPLSERFNSEENDIRYSRELDALDYITPDEELEEVDETAFSNRTLLANALLDTITSSEEYKLVRSYQEEIAGLDKSDKRLQQLKKDRNQIYKQENPNFEVIKELNEKIKALEGEIVNRDKRLLRLESTTALKNVLERAKKDAYSKAMEKGKETMHRAVERRYKTIERDKAKKTAHELQMLLDKNDKKRNVKLGEQAIVRAALDLSDMYFVTDDDIIMNGIKVETLDRENDAIAQYRVLYERLHATDDDVTNHKEERTQLRHEMNEVKNGLKDLLERERRRINNTKASSVYDAVINEYEKLQASPDTHVSNAFDANVLAHLKKLKTDLGNKLISDMTLEELKNVNQAFSMIKHMVVNSNKMFREGRTEDIQEKATKIMSEISKVGKDQRDRQETIANALDAIDKLGWDNLRPVDAFELMGSDGLTDLFWDAVSAQDVYANDIVEYQEKLEKSRIKHGYKNWEFKPVTTFNTYDGRELKLTLGEMMSIYAYSKRAQADEHLREGGIQFKKNSVYKENKVTKKRSGEELTYKITDALRIEIISKLTQEQRAYVDDMQQILTDWGQKGNEVTRVLYGIDLFNEEKYFPLRSSHDYLPSANTQLGQTVTTASLVGSGFAKSTTPHANNPIILDSFDNVVHEHIDKMSKYHAYVIPIENLRKILDAQVTGPNDQRLSLKAKIRARLGAGAEGYLEQYITDLNGGASQNYDNGLMRLFGKAKGAQVAANLSVWVQQYFSVIRAMNEIDFKYFASFVGESYTHPDMKLYDEMKKYAPITVIKEMGGFDVGSHGSVAKYVGQTDTGLSKEKISQKMQDAFGVGANAMDKLGWMTIWKAVKKEIAATGQYKLGSEKFYNACGKRMNEVITKTQVYDSVNARSGNMRKKSDWWKMATSFMGEPTTIVGMAEVDIVKYLRAKASGDKKATRIALGTLAGTMAILSISTAMTSIAKSLIYAMRDDDEDETYPEKYAAALAGAFKDDVNPMSYLPIMRDIKSIIDGYSVERPDMTLIEDLINASKKLIDKNDEESIEQTFKDAINFMTSISNVFSIPLKNIIRDFKGLYITISNIGNGYDTNLKFALEEGLSGKDKTKSYSIYIAELRGDTDRINYYKSTYKDDEDNSKYYSALRKAIRENDPRVETAAIARLDGDNDTYYNLMYDIIEEGHFDSELIKNAFEAEYNFQKNKREEAENEE